MNLPLPHRTAARATVAVLALAVLVASSRADAALRPRVLLMGDSISFGYAPYVAEILATRADVQRIEGTVEATIRPVGGLRLDTVAARAALPRWLGAETWDVIHFNWGLHDVKLLPGGKHQVELAEYGRNLRELVAALKRTGATLVWASTTPIPPGTEHSNYPRRAGDEQAYNQVAEKIMADEGIPVDDLHAFVATHAAARQRTANVHFTEEGSRALAAEVARSIGAALEQRAVARGTTHAPGR